MEDGDLSSKPVSFVASILALRATTEKSFLAVTRNRARMAVPVAFVM
jgi:hypothetical protein